MVTMLLVHVPTKKQKERGFTTKLWEYISGKPTVRSVGNLYQRSVYKVGQEARIRYPSKRYTRIDLGIEFKSAMEANYARFLDYKGVKWDYEREIFTFPSGASKIGITRYKPDFRVFYNKTPYFIEVKGFMDQADAEKIRLFKVYYPWIKLLILYPKDYNLIRKYYSKYIPNWE